jgi:hypothetical protein
MCPLFQFCCILYYLSCKNGLFTLLQEYGSLKEKVQTQILLSLLFMWSMVAILCFPF